MYKPRIYAALGTAATVAAALLLMTCTSLQATQMPSPQSKAMVEVAQVDEEMLYDVMPPEQLLPLASDEPAQAAGDPDAQAQPAPASGTDMASSGPEGPAPAQASSTKPSETTVAAQQPLQPGTTKPDDSQETSNQISSTVSDAFSAAGAHNTQHGTADNGDAGKPDASSPAGQYNGSATGSSNWGGWKIPAYGRIKSPNTGQVKMKVTIDRTGKVTSVEIIERTPPAGTNSSVCNACVVEVRSRQFTRPDPENAKEQTVGYITYTFR